MEWVLAAVGLIVWLLILAAAVRRHARLDETPAPGAGLNDMTEMSVSGAFVAAGTALMILWTSLAWPVVYVGVLGLAFVLRRRSVAR